MPDSLPDLARALAAAVRARDADRSAELRARIDAHPGASELDRLRAELAHLRVTAFRTAAQLERLPALDAAFEAGGDRDALAMVRVMRGVAASRGDDPLETLRWAFDALDLHPAEPLTRALAHRLIASANSRLGRPRARLDALREAMDALREADEPVDAAMVEVELAQARLLAGEAVDLDAVQVRVDAGPNPFARAALLDVRATAAALADDARGHLDAVLQFASLGERAGPTNPLALQGRIAAGRAHAVFGDPTAAEPLLAPLPAPMPRLEAERAVARAHLHLRRAEIAEAEAVLADAPPPSGVERASRLALEAAIAAHRGRDEPCARALAELPTASGRRQAPWSEARELLALAERLPDAASRARHRLRAAAVDRVAFPDTCAELVAGRRAGLPVPVGPWDLEQRIAAGGMGEVWRARHVHTGAPAAMKLLKRHGRTPAAMDALRREARLIGALRHPGIVRLLGAGAVPRSAEIASGGGLAADTPWIAMEFVPGGTLAPWCGELEWPAVRGLLVNLLDALAHAHARGVLHLDLKPHNVLVDTEEGALVARLTDFGMAWLRAPDAALDGKVAGTPTAMAPEQWAGRWRLFGPETDLYGLGCLAWQLATGEFLFGFGTPLELREAHVRAPLPDFAPRRPMPAGLGDWLAALLAKAPQDRPRSATHAARDLLALGPPTGEGGARAPRAGLRVVDTTVVLTDLALGDDLPDGSSGLPTTPPTVPLAVADQPPPDAPALRLIGRDADKRTCWAAFLEVSRTGRPAGLALRGERGSGLSALVDALLGQAATWGALPLRVRRSDATLADLVGRWLQLAPGDKDTVVARHLDRFLGPVDPAVRERLRSVLDGARDPGAVNGALSALSARGPVVVDLGDLDGRASPVSLALLEASGDLSGPVLRVGVGDGRPGLPARDIAPLPAERVTEAVVARFGVRAKDAASLVGAAGGRLADTLALAAALADRELLVPGPDGLMVPDLRLLGSLATGDRTRAEERARLQVAAALPEPFSEADFLALADAVEVPGPSLDALAARGLLEAPERGGAGWRFPDARARAAARASTSPRLRHALDDAARSRLLARRDAL